MIVVVVAAVVEVVVTVVVVDATCIERNLNLVYQIMEITPNVIACVNLLDEAEKKGIDFLKDAPE